MERIVFFDGVCNLCHGFVQFLIARDPEARFRMASLQSAKAQEVLKDPKYTQLDTVVYFKKGKVFVKSDAVLEIAADLPMPWPLFVPFKLIPRGLRDWFYDRVANSRYRLFGKKDVCPLPRPEHKKWFL